MFKIRFPLRQKKPPCAWCPYALGLIQTLFWPCPRCRRDGRLICEGIRIGGFTPGPVSIASQNPIPK